MADAALMVTIVAGGTWPNSRIAETNEMHDSACPFCQAPHQTEFHMFWNCPVHRTSEDPAIIRTQNLLAQAREGYTAGQHAYWIRTMIPGEWTTPSKPPSQYIIQLGEGSVIRPHSPHDLYRWFGGRCHSRPKIQKMWVGMDRHGLSNGLSIVWGAGPPIHRGPTRPNSPQCRAPGFVPMYISNSMVTPCHTC